MNGICDADGVAKSQWIVWPVDSSESLELCNHHTQALRKWDERPGHFLAVKVSPTVGQLPPMLVIEVNIPEAEKLSDADKADLAQHHVWAASHPMMGA